MKIIITFLSFASLAALAEEPQSPVHHKNFNCSSEKPIEFNKCAKVKYIEVDKKLNETYMKLHESLLSSETLEKAEVAWIKYRDASCEYNNSSIVPQNSYYEAFNYSCLIYYTELRTKDLEAYILWDGGAAPEKKLKPK